DIAAALPTAPPPAPARRAAAIDLALRRFDGKTEAVPARAPVRRARHYRWVGALVAATLVALVAAPVARETMRQRPGAERSQPPAAVATNEPPPSAAPEPAADAVAGQATDSHRGEAADTVTSEVADAVVAPAPAPPPPAEADVPPPPAPPPPPAEMAPEPVIEPSPAPMAITGSRIRGYGPAAPAARSVDSAIVVTGSRVSAPRGDWNSCTIDDPARSLSSCRSLARARTAGPNARVAEGVGLAWQGELDSAIAAFDRAIALAPRSAPAYLNRGLVYRRKGELDRARADLDRAVRLAPGAARGYFQRSLLLRQQGKEAAAKADAERALALDPGYDAVIGRR
ncbi:MAG: tetratricopeptide repeat protein, partial [Allosphingosinicella sp.]